MTAIMTPWEKVARQQTRIILLTVFHIVCVICLAAGLYYTVRFMHHPDFVLIQVGWMVSGLHFATTRRLCRERGHLAFRRDFLHQLTDDSSVDRLCDLVQ